MTVTPPLTVAALAVADGPADAVGVVQLACEEASLALTVPTEAKVSAGLAVVQNEAHLYYLGVRREGEGLALFLELAAAGDDEAAATPIGAPA